MTLHPQAREIASYIQYEVDMFVSTAAQLNPSNDQPLFGGARNAMLESFLIHARVLKDFFFSVPKDDDVSAKHFFNNDDDWSLDGETECPYLFAHSKRLNKAVAHLSYKRIGYEMSKQWEIGIICRELMTVWGRFLNSLQSERRQWFPFPKERTSVVI